MNRSISILLIISLSWCAGAFAQDKIHLKSGNVVEVVVIGSDRENVLGKSTNPADKQVYEYPKEEVLMIEYEDGRKEYFDEVQQDETEQEEKFVEENELEDEKTKEEIYKPQKRNVFYVGTFAGASFPILRYGSTGGYDHGFAETGWYFNLETALTFKSWFGMGLTIGGGKNAIQESAVERKWELPSFSNYESHTGQYTHFYLMIGPHVSIKNGSKLYIDIKLRYGMSITSEPSYEVQYQDSLGNSVLVNNRDSVYGLTSGSIFPLSVSAGAMLRYNITDRFGLAFQLDWIFLPYVFASQQHIRVYNANDQLIQSTRNEIEDIGIASMNYVGLGVYFNFIKSR